VFDKWFNLLLKPSFSFGRDMVLNLVNVVYYIVTFKIDMREFVKQSFHYIFSVVVSVILVSVALGVVLGIQIGPEFVSKGLGNKFGILAAITMSRELIPVLGCMMIATQYGTGVASELANMKVTEQVDALKVLKVDPAYHLILPRFLAGLLFTPLIIWFSTVVAIFSSYLIVRLKTGLVWSSFQSSIIDYFSLKDIMLCVFKASVFGMVIVLVATTRGLQARGGAKDVGQATTMTVILSFIFVIVIDLIITWVYLR
jgi:phospholipid/cholesterol/gamma-HCH transport system permease protein